MRAALLSIFIALLAALPARGADTIFYPRLDRSAFSALIAPVTMGEDQRFIAQMLFADYTSGMSDLMVQANTRANEAGRQRVDDALSGRRRMSPEELRAKRIAVLEVQRELWPQSDELLDDMLGTLVGVLNDEQREPIDAALPALRRSLWLEPWRARHKEREYAGEGLDVVELVEDSWNQEFAGIDADEVAAILGQYETHMDALLADAGPQLRAAFLDRRIARITKDLDRMRAAERSIIEAWRQLSALNEHAATSIAAAAGRIGPEAVAAWNRRVRRATWPWLVESTGPRRRIEWIRQSGAEAETLAVAERIYQQFAQRRDTLITEAVTLMLEARLEHGRIIHPAIDPATVDGNRERELYQDLLKNSGARSHAERDASERLDAALPAAKRAAMRREVR